MSVDGRTICTNILYELGVLGAGEDPDDADLEFVLSKVNRMLGLWRNQKKFVYEIVASTFTLSPAQASYTIGPTGDFVVSTGRPKTIERANIILTAQTPDRRVPLTIIQVEEYADVAIPADTAEYPSELYYKKSVPNGTIYLLPVLTDTANQLELFTWRPLPSFATLDTSVDLPDGYEEAITLSGAEACSGKAFGVELTPELQISARTARIAVQSLNSPPPRTESDCPGVCHDRG